MTNRNEQATGKEHGKQKRGGRSRDGDGARTRDLKKSVTMKATPAAPAGDAREETAVEGERLLARASEGALETKDDDEAARSNHD